MTLMKQARAFGVGVVLATQNPVDIDYKAISNAGTWMIGRLQTERDKDRLLEGMTAAAGNVDVGAVGDTISGLAKREFVLRRAGKDKPEVFTTPLGHELPARPADPGPDPHADGRPRRGPAPLRRRRPSPPAPARRRRRPAPAAAARPRPAAAAPRSADDETTVMPEVAGGHAGALGRPGGAVAARRSARPSGGNRYEAAAVARVRLRYDDEKADLVADEE